MKKIILFLALITFCKVKAQVPYGSTPYIQVNVTSTVASSTGTVPAYGVVTTPTAIVLPSGKWVLTSIISKQLTGNYTSIYVMTTQSLPTYTLSAAMNSSVAVDSFLGIYPMQQQTIGGSSGAIFIYKAYSTTDLIYVKDQIYTGTFYITQLNVTNGTSFTNGQSCNLTLCFRKV